MISNNLIETFKTIPMSSSTYIVKIYLTNLSYGEKILIKMEL